MSRDLLGQCNDKGQAPEDFKRAWCARCLNPECSRSLHGKMRMDQRAQTWEKALFTEVPRLTPQDPRYLKIAGQGFRHVEIGRTPEIRTDWFDPTEAPTVRDLPTVPPQQAPPTSFQEEVPAPVGIPAHLYGKNAPTQTGRVLPGGPAQAKDPWAAPVGPPPTQGTVVAPGARVRLSGVQAGAGDKKP